MLRSTTTTRKVSKRVASSVTVSYSSVRRGVVTYESEDGNAPNRHLLDTNSPSSGLVLPNFPQRRESFLYRSESEYEMSPKSVSRHSSIGGTTEVHCEDLIVTPFAQILASLRNVRNNYICLTNVAPSRCRRSSNTAATISATLSNKTNLTE